MTSNTKHIAMFIAIPLTLIACRTLDPSGESIPVSEKSYEGCVNLGIVNIDWAWWGGFFRNFKRPS